VDIYNLNVVGTKFIIWSLISAFKLAPIIGDDRAVVEKLRK
jgi:hypothetical protein